MATSQTEPGFSKEFSYEGGTTLRLEEWLYKGPSRWIPVDLSPVLGDPPTHVSRADTAVTSESGIRFSVGADQSLSARRPDGSQVWRIDYLPGVLTLAGDRLIVRHSYQRMVSAVSATDGTLLWQTEDLGLPASYPDGAFVTRDGRVAVTGYYLHFYDLETGRYLGRTGEAVGRGILVLDDQLFTMTYRSLRAFDLE